MSRARRLLHLSIAAAMLALALVAVAFSAAANGGASIASAPTLPLGQTVTSGWNVTDYVDNTGRYGEFWRLPMHIGDKLTIDWAQLSKSSDCNNGGNLFIYSPSTTDFTISKTNPVESQGGTYATKYEFVWAAPQDGNWILYLYSGCARQEGYSVNATVQLFTVTTLAPPAALVKTGAKVRLHGAVSANPGGAVLVTVKGPKGFAPLAKATPLKGGAFSFAFKASLPGSYRVKARFPGDSTHRASASKIYSVRAA